MVGQLHCETCKRARCRDGLVAETGELFEMLVQTADALDYIHSQGIVHREIKLRMCIKVADFCGLGCRCGAQHSRSPS